MMGELPSDLVAFLQAGKQLEYDDAGSIIGRIRLKRLNEMSPSRITILPPCDTIIDDPYENLRGAYLIDVYDLVAESDDYHPVGLFCWIVSLQQFGCVDDEHGSVIAFPGITWTTIAEHSLPFLEAQWVEHRAMVRVLPWVHFPFELSETGEVLAPYPERCPVHRIPVTVQRKVKPPLFDVWRRRELDDWLRHYRTTFPCSGVPVAEGELWCCSACRSAEDAWTEETGDKIQPIDAKPNAHGWIQCPGCGIRFLATDEAVFSADIHLRCGQKVRISA